MSQILWFSLRFLVIYALLQGAFSLTPLGGAAAQLIGPVAARTLSICSGKEVGLRHREGIIVLIVRAGNGPPWPSPEVGASWYTRNIPMFLALVLAASLRPNRRALGLLAFGLVAVLVLDGWIVAAHAWNSMREAVPLNAVGHVLSVLGVWTLGGFSVAPLFIAAAVLFGVGAQSATQISGSVARNAPCPCGSGLKYKRCCGEDAAARPAS